MSDNSLEEIKLFFRKTEGVKTWIGIDPGSSGAIAFVTEEKYKVTDIPTLKVKRGKGNKTVANYPAIINMFRTLSRFSRTCYVCLEQPPPSMGPGRGSAYAQFALGVHYAIWPLFLLSKNIPLEEVSPATWKKAMKVGKDKEDVRHKALKMFPKAEITRKKDHNRAEALLLAEYLRRLHNGGK